MGWRWRFRRVSKSAVPKLYECGHVQESHDTEENCWCKVVGCRCDEFEFLEEVDI